ncbi:MAG: hypothetical protein JJ902_13870 [Roseibium sp.]|nr:hypothetical protein [Roseibium sp.]
MLHQWTVLYSHLLSVSRNRKQDAFQDPLERPEWEAFLPVFLWMLKCANAMSPLGGTRLGKAEEYPLVADKPIRTRRQGHPALVVKTDVHR